MRNCGYKTGFACNRVLSASMKCFLSIIPLVVVYGFMAVLGPKDSSWVFISGHPWPWGYGISTSANTSVEIMPIAHAIEGQEQAVGLKVVVVVGGGGAQNREEKKALSVESPALHRSSSPPQAVLPMREPQLGILLVFCLVSLGLAILWVGFFFRGGLMELLATCKIIRQNVTKEDGLNISSSGTPIEVPDLSMETTRQTVGTNLQKLEAGLQNARAAIKEAKNGNQTQDPDYVPVGPIYWNAKVFHRSYLEMERQFKVFVYEEGEPPVFHNGPCKSIYSMEGNFIHAMEINQRFRTKDPEKAHVYFLPFSVAMMVQFVYVRDSHDFGPIRRTVTDFVDLVAGKYPYWNRSLGADHFMVACHDWGPEASFSNPHLGKNSIRALCNANTSERFNPIKDVSFPEINLQTGSIEGFIGGPSPSKRPILAFFAGGLHGPIRPVVLKHWENKDEDIQVHQYLPKGVSYYEMMRKSKFCLCPSGYEVASPRVVEAFYTGCVPVLISDHYVPPFSDVLNWKSFSVEVPMKDVPNLKRILTSISPRQYIRMQRRVVQIRRHFAVHSPPKRFDVFHMILHSIWLRRLNTKIRDDQLAITTRLKNGHF